MKDKMNRGSFLKQKVNGCLKCPPFRGHTTTNIQGVMKTFNTVDHTTRHVGDERLIRYWAMIFQI